MAVRFSLLLISGILIVAAVVPFTKVQADVTTGCPSFSCSQNSFQVGFFFARPGPEDEIETGLEVLNQENLGGILGFPGKEPIASIDNTKVSKCVASCKAYNAEAVSSGGKLAAYWTFSLTVIMDDSGSGSFQGRCYCYSLDACSTLDFNSQSTVMKQPNTFASYVTGSLCITIGKGEPHFTGADKSHYDFSGIPNKHFALISDPAIQVNAFFGGRYDSFNGNPHKALTWMRNIGILWGRHTIVLEARRGAEWRYNNGYMQRVAVNGKTLKIASPGDEVQAANGAIQIRWTLGGEPDGDDVVDRYEVIVGDILTLGLVLRPEVPDLRTKADGVVHFTVQVLHAKFSHNVHGVLGQTYRPDFAGRLEEQELVYNDVLAVDMVPGDNAEGFIDGKVEDYMVSGLLSADCKVTRFSPVAVGLTRRLFRLF